MKERKVKDEGYEKIVNNASHELGDAQVSLVVEARSNRSDSSKTRVEAAKIRLSFAQKEVDIKKRKSAFREEEAITSKLERQKNKYKPRWKS